MAAENKPKDVHMDCKWQTRDEMPYPTNPLQELTEILCRSSRDIGGDKMLACIYGIVVGWDDNSYNELKITHGWTDKNIALQKMWHQNFIKAWNITYPDVKELL